jgi:hypothetical protein
MITAIFIIGKPGSGKSIMVWYLAGLLEADGYHVSFLSDRIGLEQGTLKDVVRVKAGPDGVKVGKHSKLIADGPPGHRKVHVLDGMILNAVHKDMVKKAAASGERKSIMLGEYAIGPDIKFGSKKEPLLQSTHHLVSFIKKYKALKSIFVLDIEASLAQREYRQSSRPDSMAQETFRAYFPDGGEMSKADAKFLRGNYYRFVNRDDDHDGYYSEARYMYETHIRSKLQT